MTQLTLFPGVPSPTRPRRRQPWRAALSRALAYAQDQRARDLALLDDQRARDQQRHAETVGRLRSTVAALQERVTDLERDVNADMHRAPTRNGELRAFAR